MGIAPRLAFWCGSYMRFVSNTLGLSPQDCRATLFGRLRRRIRTKKPKRSIPYMVMFFLDYDDAVFVQLLWLWLLLSGGLLCSFIGAHTVSACSMLALSVVVILSSSRHDRAMRTASYPS